MPANAFPNTNIRTVQVRELIEYSMRESGAVLAEQQTPQYVSAARLALQLTLQELSNKSELLFQYKEILAGSNAGQRQILLPAGTINILAINSLYSQPPSIAVALPSNNPSASNAFARNLNLAATTAVFENYLGADLGAGNGISCSYVGFNSFGNTSYPQLLLEFSDDGLTWTLQQTLDATTLNDREWQYYQIDGAGQGLPRRFWRIRSASTTTPFSVRQIVFGTPLGSQIPLYQFNKTEYFNLPQRQNTSQRSLQFWFDKQSVYPIVKVWPAPADDWQVFFMLLESQMPDVGNLGDTINIPERWLLAVQSRLSAKLSLQLPNVAGDRIGLLQQLADQAYTLAASKERDNAGFYIRPQISSYTRP